MSPTQVPPTAPLAPAQLTQLFSPIGKQPMELQAFLSLSSLAKDTKPRSLLILTQSIAGPFATLGKLWEILHVY